MGVTDKVWNALTSMIKLEDAQPAACRPVIVGLRKVNFGFYPPLQITSAAADRIKNREI